MLSNVEEKKIFISGTFSKEKSRLLSFSARFVYYFGLVSPLPGNLFASVRSPVTIFSIPVQFLFSVHVPVSVSLP
jgi:hypothetical protein